MEEPSGGEEGEDEENEDAAEENADEVPADMEEAEAVCFRTEESAPSPSRGLLPVPPECVSGDDCPEDMAGDASASDDNVAAGDATEVEECGASPDSCFRGCWWNSPCLADSAILLLIRCRSFVTKESFRMRNPFRSVDFFSLLP